MSHWTCSLAPPDTTQLHYIALTATKPVLASIDSLTIGFVTITTCS
jgi:hypothetical protein